MVWATKTPTRSGREVGGLIDMLPYNYSMKLLRRRDVMDLLGVSETQFKKLVAAGLVKPIRKRGCRAWYRAKDIETI